MFSISGALFLSCCFVLGLILKLQRPYISLTEEFVCVCLPTLTAVDYDYLRCFTLLFFWVTSGLM